MTDSNPKHNDSRENFLRPFPKMTPEELDQLAIDAKAAIESSEKFLAELAQKKRGNASPETPENRWGPSLAENQYKAMQQSFDLPPWDELSEDEKENFRKGANG